MSEARQQFAERYNVPRGTLEKFDIYAAMLGEWQEKMNLVGRATLPYVWDRHFADSAQLLQHAKAGSWLDIGAGAGFPGIVVALLGAQPVNLVEATTKKCLFLQAVVEALELEVIVHNARIETLRLPRVANISARACASLTKLFDWGLPFATEDTRWLLMKGASVEQEVEDARQIFSFAADLIPSVTDPRGRIVCARSVRRTRR